VKLSLGPARPEPGGGVCAGGSSGFCAAARHVRNGGCARVSQDWVLGIRWVSPAGATAEVAAGLLMAGGEEGSVLLGCRAAGGG
jgi:hypothetical protein